MSTAKKKATQKKADAPALEVLFSCTVISRCKIGSMICSPGAQAKLPKEKADALKDLGKVRIDGIA